MFMDAIGMLLLTLPVVYPAVMALNGGEMVSAADSAFGMSGHDVCDLVWNSGGKNGRVLLDHAAHRFELLCGGRVCAMI